MKAADPLRGTSTTKPGSTLRTSITIRKADDEIADELGWFDVDTVAHCGPTLVAEFARTVNLTDMLVGWVHTITIRTRSRNSVNASRHHVCIACIYS